MGLIGADGIWSTLRHHLFPQVQPQFSGLIAWRGTLDATQLPREHTSRRVQVWMGPQAHLVAYPISGAQRINVVAVVPGTWNRPGWSAPGETHEIKNAFASTRWSIDPDVTMRRSIAFMFTTLFGLYLGLIVWGGLWLRDRNSQTLLPWRH